MLRWDDINVRNSFGIYLSSVPLNFAGLPKLYTHFPLEYKSEILFLVFRRSGSNHLIIYFKMREIATNPGGGFRELSFDSGLLGNQQDKVKRLCSLRFLFCRASCLPLQGSTKGERLFRRCTRPNSQVQ